MQTFYMRVQLLFQFVKMCGFLCESIITHLLYDLGSLAQLIHHQTFLCLVGVQFEAEWGKPDVGKPFLYNLQCGHFLCDKQHALAMEEGICYDVGDGLRLAGARRTMQNKTLA